MKICGYSPNLNIHIQSISQKHFEKKKKKAHWWIADLVFQLFLFRSFHFDAPQRYCFIMYERVLGTADKMNDVCVLPCVRACVFVRAKRHFHTVWSRIEIPVLWKTQAWNAKITSSGSPLISLNVFEAGASSVRKKETTQRDQSASPHKFIHLFSCIQSRTS